MVVLALQCNWLPHIGPGTSVGPASGTGKPFPKTSYFRPPVGDVSIHVLLYHHHHHQQKLLTHSMTSESSVNYPLEGKLALITGCTYDISLPIVSERVC